MGRGRAEPAPCTQCGEVAVRRLSGVERLRHWFVDGGGLRAEVERCAACGASSASWSASYRLLRTQRGLHRPLGVVRALRQQRHWHPVPVFYALIGAIGAVVAVPVAALTPLPWASVPLVAVVAVAVAFGLSLASAFGQGRGRQAMLEGWDPERAFAKERAEQRRSLRRAAPSFALLAPADWPGEVALSGGGWRHDRSGRVEVVSVSVVADVGDPAAPTAAVRCETRRDPHGPEAVEPELTHELAQRERHRAGQDPPLDTAGRDPAEIQRRLQERMAAEDREVERRVAELAWHDGRLRVDGEVVPARRLTGEGVEAAVVVIDEQVVSVLAEQVALDDLALVRVRDPAPLVDAAEARERRMFAPRDPG